MLRISLYHFFTLKGKGARLKIIKGALNIMMAERSNRIPLSNTIRRLLKCCMLNMWKLKAKKISLQTVNSSNKIITRKTMTMCWFWELSRPCNRFIVFENGR